MPETRTAHYLKYFCEHEKYKYQCRECKGSQICPHSKRKPQCKECAGSQICSHNREKNRCKKCRDPITVNIEQWIFSSYFADMQKLEFLKSDLIYTAAATENPAKQPEQSSVRTQKFADQFRAWTQILYIFFALVRKCLAEKKKFFIATLKRKTN